MADDRRWIHLKSMQSYFLDNHKFVVYRPSEEIQKLRDFQVPKHYDGWWYPISEHHQQQDAIKMDLSKPRVAFYPTDKFEMREDGEVARVWELRLDHDHG